MSKKHNVVRAASLAVVAVALAQALPAQASDSPPGYGGLDAIIGWLLRLFV